MQGIDWSFIPEWAPHFSGLREAAIKSTKKHLTRVVGNVKLTFEELCTVLSQIEACLNNHPLTSLPSDNDSIQVFTLGHFRIERPLKPLSGSPSSHRPVSALWHGELCQSMVRHFWWRWSSKYLVALQMLQSGIPLPAAWPFEMSWCYGRMGYYLLDGLWQELPRHTLAKTTLNE